MLSIISLLSPGTSTCNTVTIGRISKQRAIRADNANLEPTERLSLRLNHNVDYIIDDFKKKYRCEIHYWAAGIKTMDCLSCSISMCNKCCGLFHRVQDLNSMKHRIHNYILNDIEHAGR